VLPKSRKGARMCGNNCLIAFASDRIRDAIRERIDSAIRAFNFQTKLSTNYINEDERPIVIV